MDLKRCSNGHFYDGDVYSECPHCGGSNNAEANRAGAASIDDVGATVPLFTNEGVPSETGGRRTDLGSIIEGITEAVPEEDGEKTVGFFEKEVGNPVVGWLVCVEGKHFGEDFKLKAGRNYIGRAANMDVRLSEDNTVSRERHLIVLYDPNNNIFIVQAGDSKELSYHNEQLVLSPVELKAYDVLKVGANKLLFVPFCSDKFTWKIVESADNEE